MTPGLLAPEGTTSTAAVFVLERSPQRPEAGGWSDYLASVQPSDEAEFASLAGSLRADDLAYLACAGDTAASSPTRPVDHASAQAEWSWLVSRTAKVSVRDRVLADVPLAHPAGLATAVVLPLLTGCRPFFVDDPRESPAAAEEIQPSIRIATARHWVVAGQRDLR